MRDLFPSVTLCALFEPGGGMMMSLSAAVRRTPLVLLVDSCVTSRHRMWRALSRPFGVLEAGGARSAREWLARRPDIDALVVQDELPDQRGLELVRELARESHPVASRAIVLARSSVLEEVAQAGSILTLVEQGDLRTVLAKLTSWLLSYKPGIARSLMREADRLGANARAQRTAS